MNKTPAIKLIGAFILGLIVSQAVQEFDIQIISNSKAAVAGMDYNNLRRDRDFRRAVESIIEGCAVSGGSISC